MELIGFFEPLTLNNTTCLDYSRVIRPVPMPWLGVAGFTGGAARWAGPPGSGKRWGGGWVGQKVGRASPPAFLKIPSPLMGEGQGEGVDPCRAGTARRTALSLSFGF